MSNRSPGSRWVTLWTLLVPAFAATGVQAQRLIDIPDGDRALNLNAEQVYSVGSMMGDEWETFGEVGSVAFDAEGNLYILDAQSHRVVVVDSEGNFLREFGKEGDGPGELRFPRDLVVTPDGIVAVRDMGHQALVLFESNGTYLHNARNDFQTGLLGGDLWYHPSGGVVGASMGVSVRAGPGGTVTSGGGTTTPVKLVPFTENSESEILYEAWRLPPEEASGGGMSFSSGGGGGIRLQGMSAARAFEPPLLTGVLPEGRVVLADSTDYSIKLLTADGTLDAVLRRSFEPRAVTRRDREAEKARRIEDLDSGGGAGGAVMMIRGGGSGGGGSSTTSIGGDAMSDMMRDRIENMVFAEEVPVLSALAVDWEGRLWVQRTGDRVGEDGPTDLVTADGQYLGSIPADGLRIPDAFGPDGLIANIETDEFDVPTVVVQRLPAVH